MVIQESRSSAKSSFNTTHTTSCSAFIQKLCTL